MSGSCYHSILDDVGRAVDKKPPALSMRQAGTGLAAIGGRGLAGETLYLFGYMRGESQRKMTFRGGRLTLSRRRRAEVLKFTAPLFGIDGLELALPFYLITLWFRWLLTTARICSHSISNSGFLSRYIAYSCTASKIRQTIRLSVWPSELRSELSALCCLEFSLQCSHSQLLCVIQNDYICITKVIHFMIE
ncbi:hypothetical protein SMETW2_47610 (plasmid) [Serratia marcescens]|nr:hypothetical protein SMETW2_47610 [Serratia marcescens]